MSNVLLKAFYLTKPLSNCGGRHGRDASRQDVCGSRRHPAVARPLIRRFVLPACHARDEVSRATSNSPRSLPPAQHAQPVAAAAAELDRPLSGLVA